MAYMKPIKKKNGITHWYSRIESVRWIQPKYISLETNSKTDARVRHAMVEKVEDEIQSKPRKLKKISIEDIADKINKTSKRPDKTQGDPAKKNIKQNLLQFGKSPSRKTKRI